MIDDEAQGELRQRAAVGERPEALDLVEVLEKRPPLVRFLVPVLTEIALRKSCVRCEFPRENPHRQSATDDHADVVLLTIWEDLLLRGSVENAVINLQR